MKATELRQILRKIIKEEVAAEVSKAMGKILVEMVKEIKTNNQSPVIRERREPAIAREVEHEVERPKTNMPVLKTNNPKLNSVLEQMAHNFKPNIKTNDASLVELMDGGFDKIGQNESVGVVEPMSTPATKLDFLKQMVGSSPAISQPSVLDAGTEVPDGLKKVFKTDFRALMKRIDEQKSGKASGGYIDPSKVIVSG